MAALLQALPQVRGMTTDAQNTADRSGGPNVRLSAEKERRRECQQDWHVCWPLAEACSTQPKDRGTWGDRQAC